MNPSATHCQCAVSFSQTPSSACGWCVDCTTCGCNDCASDCRKAESRYQESLASSHQAQATLVNLIDDSSALPVPTMAQVASPLCQKMFEVDTSVPPRAPSPDTPRPRSMCVGACHRLASCSVCHVTMPGTRGKVCYVYTEPHERMSCVHFQYGCTIGKMLEAFPGFRVLRVIAWPAIGNEPLATAKNGCVDSRYFVENQCDYQLVVSGLGGKNPKPAGKKVAAKVKKVKKEVKAVKKMVKRASAPLKSLKGHGDYADTVGTVVGSGIRKGVNWLSGKAKSWLGSLFGSGDYTGHAAIPDENSLWHTQNLPRMDSSSNKPGVVRHCEFLMNIPSSANFTTRSISINPGLVSTFPWLSLSARAYQRYRIKGMVVELRSTIGPYGGANVNGSMMLSARYDQSLSAPSTASQALNSKFAVSGRPVDNVLMAIECAHNMTPVNVHEIRAGALPDTADYSLYDHCIVDISTVGQEDSSINIAQVWISYEIELELPIAEEGAASTAIGDHFVMTNCATDAMFGDAAPMAASNIGCIVSSSQIQFPSWIMDGVFFISYNTSCTSGVQSVNPTWTLTGCSGVDGFSNGSYSRGAPANGETSTRRAQDLIVRINSPGATIAMTGLTQVAGSGDLYITPIESDITGATFMRRRFGHLFQAAFDREQRLINAAVDRMRFMSRHVQEDVKRPEPDDASVSSEESYEVAPLMRPKQVGVHIDLTRSELAEFIKTSTLPSEPLLSRKGV